jgi:hypothetical protein
MLNFAAGRLARLRYLSGSFQVVAQGDHVLCALTAARIPLDDLRYWSHELQEAYADATVAHRRHTEARAMGRL